MAEHMGTEFTRHKSAPRDLASRALARCGLAFYDMCLGTAALAPLADVPAPTAGLSVRLVGAREIERQEQLQGTGTAARLASNRRLGGQCWGAFRHDALAGYAWVNSRVFVFLGQALWNLPSGTLCVHDVQVFASHRGNRILRHLVAAIFSRGISDGHHAAFCVVDRANTAALAGFRRCGLRFRRAPILKFPGLAPIQLGARSVHEIGS